MFGDSNGHAGLGKGFALTPEQQRIAGIGDVPVRKSVHPEGVEGTKFSLQEMSKAIQGDLKDPKTVALLRGWGGRTLLAAGNPTNETQQAQAILDAIRKRTVYVQDPINTEMIVKAKTTLCLEDGKLCIPAADCFPQGTKVLRRRDREGATFDLVSIENVAPGDMIWGRNNWSRVLNWTDKGDLGLDVLGLSNDTKIALSPDHSLYVHLDAFATSRIQVKDAKVGAVLLQPERDDLCHHRRTHSDNEAKDWVRVPPNFARREKTLTVTAIERGAGKAHCYDIATSDHFVYLPEHDVTVSNCDDRIVAYVAVMMSLGIDCRLVAQAFGTERATHVICAFRDPAKGWVRLDPSAKDWPVGKYHPATKEWWMDPTSGTLSMSADGMPVSLGKEPEHGDFIGVGAVPEGLPEGLGVFPFAHAFSPLSHGAAYAPVGLREGEWPPYPVTLDEIHAMGLGVDPLAHAFSPEVGEGTNAYSPIPIGLGQDGTDYPVTVGGGGSGQYPNTSVLGPGGTSGWSTTPGGVLGYYGYDENTTFPDIQQGVSNAATAAAPAVAATNSITEWLAVGAVAVASIVVVGPLVWEWMAERRVARAARHGAK